MSFGEILTNHPWLETSIWIVGLILAAVVINLVVRIALVRLLHHFLEKMSFIRGQDVIQSGVLRSIANAAPAMFIAETIPMIPGLRAGVTTLLSNVATAVNILIVAMAMSAMLDLFHRFWQSKSSNQERSIKGYIQVISIGIYVVAVIMMIAAIADRSPAILLSGLGAMTAVLILVFQDTLHGLLASMQINSSNMVKVGDWIEVPSHMADGHVSEIALYTVKVNNWDNTVTTVPIRAIVTQSVKNWRVMQETGGRRIKRTLLIDQHSIRNMTGEEFERMKRIRILREYVARREVEVSMWNTEAGYDADAADLINVTNIGLFRAYIEGYLRAHAQIHQEMMLMVRMMQPTPEGLPLEVYCFSRQVRFADFERVQSEVFEHLYSVLGEFGVALYQRPAGAPPAPPMDPIAALAPAPPQQLHGVPSISRPLPI